VLAAAQQMIIISCLLGAKQQTRSSGVQRMNNRTDGRLTVTQTLRGVPNNTILSGTQWSAPPTSNSS